MKTVCICGSKRYKDEIDQFCSELSDLGVVVFKPNFKEPIPEDTSFQSKNLKNTVFKGLTLEHFDWIRKADVCFLYNKDGYTGVSVTLEIGYANALGKPLYALNEDTGDPCRDCLIDKVADSPTKLAEMLK